VPVDLYCLATPMAHSIRVPLYLRFVFAGPACLAPPSSLLTRHHLKLNRMLDEQGYPTDVIGGGFPIISGQDAPISASSLGYSDWTNFNTNSIVENATTPAPSRDEDNPAVIRSIAESWAQREGYNADQMTEFGHLMSMVSSTFIPKRKLGRMAALDSGSFGKIYKTTYDGVDVAVKQISNKGESTITAKMRELLLELRVLVRIRHPNVVTFWGTATEFPASENSEVKPYIGLVFELCDTGSLHNALFEKKMKLSLAQRCKIAYQCSLGLMYLHSKRVIHRDINPRNILLSKSLDAKIADFGCARVLPSNQKSLKTTTISGSPAYMAPEQLLGKELTESVDTWGLGVMLWEIMMNQKPWEGRFADFNALKNAIVTGQKLEIPRSTSFPATYVNMIKLCMSFKSSERPQMSFVEHELQKAHRHVSQ